MLPFYSLLLSFCFLTLQMFLIVTRLQLVTCHTNKMGSDLYQEKIADPYQVKILPIPTKSKYCSSLPSQNIADPYQVKMLLIPTKSKY